MNPTSFSSITSPHRFLFLFSFFLLLSSSLFHCVSSHNLNSRLGCLSQPKLVCRLRGTTRRPGVTGFVMFRPQWWANRVTGIKCGTLVRAQIQNLKPGEHGFHIHTYGDMRRDDAFLAGGHFSNPAGASLPHGYPDNPRRHWGDLGNLTAWNDGNAGYSRVDFLIRIPGIIGRAIVIHEHADMGPLEQPSGNSGKRIAQCVIGYANPNGIVI